MLTTTIFYLFLQCTNKKKTMGKFLVITNTNEAIRVSPDRIAYISSDGNYTTMVLTDKEERVFSFNLVAFERIIEQQLGTEAQIFIRLGKSIIINSKFIYYVNVSKQQIILADISFPNQFDLEASREALKALKTVLEESTKSRRIGL
mgnify:CR=1 FL=1